MNVLIFGATGAVGFAYAQSVAAIAENVILVGRSQEPGQLEQLLDSGVRYISYDMISRGQDTNILEDADPVLYDIINPLQEAEAQLDIVLFAQGMNPKPFGLRDYAELDVKIIDSHFQKMMTINITEPARIISRLEAARVVNSETCYTFLSSVATRKGSFDPAYASSKAAMTGLVASLNRAYDSRFNIISLGLIKGTPVYETILKNQGSEYISKFHAGKNGMITTLDDVVRMIDTLVNNRSIVGQTINLDCGLKT